MTNRIVLRNLAHRPVRTIVSMLAIALEVAMILLMWGTADGLIQETVERKTSLGNHILIRPGTADEEFSSGTAGIAQPLLSEMEALPEVKMAVGTVHTVPGDLMTITGVDLDRLSGMVGGLTLLEGGGFEQPYDAIVDEFYAAQKEVSAGDTITLLNKEFRVTGIMEAGKLSRIFIPRETMQQLMDWEGDLTQVYVQLHREEDTQPVIEKLKAQFPGLTIHSMEEFVSLFAAEIEGMAESFVAVIVAIALFVGFIVVLLSMYTAVLDRTREIGILKALGASPGYILGIFLRETFWIAAGGAVIGAAGGYLLAELIRQSFPLVRVDVMPNHLSWGLVIALAGALLGALYPALKAARQDPIDALAYE